MLIIADNGIYAIQYKPKSTKIKFVDKKDGRYQLVVNNKEFAVSENPLEIQILYNRLMMYCKRYRRLDDTFDITRELKIIRKEIERGKFDNFVFDQSTISVHIGYPTYTS